MIMIVGDQHIQMLCECRQQKKMRRERGKKIQNEGNKKELFCRREK
jgi:hypothetical protein